MTVVDTYKGKTILITGGRGYIGSALAEALAGVDCRLVLLDHAPEDVWRPEGRVANVWVRSADVSQRETWARVLQGVDVVFHLAAREYYYRSGYNPEEDYQLNALPMLHILEHCRLNAFRPRIVFASSANLYGQVDRLPVNEAMRDDPMTLWAVHKLTAERYLQLYARQFQCDGVALRLANVYGPTARESMMDRVVLNKVIRMALAGESIVTYSNRECIRDYVYLDDVVSAFLLAGGGHGADPNPIYVIGSGEGQSIAKTWQLMADRVEAVTGKIVPVGCDDTVEIEPLERRHFVADTARFEAATGWKPGVQLAQGVEMTIRAMISGGE